jgi:hypothetical protein
MDISCLARPIFGAWQPQYPRVSRLRPIFYPSPELSSVPARTHQLPHSLRINFMLFFFGCLYLTPKGASTMEWVTPQHEEIDLNCEVSSYANAEL